MNLQDEINQYWSKRAQEFSDRRLDDLNSDLRGIWTGILKELVPGKEAVRALDLGTGAGFFAFLLSDLGCSVTGIDYSEDMIRCAEENREKLGYDQVEFLQMDAQDLKFPDGQFDFIVTRNVLWSLPDAEKAYGEMVRVLAPGGRLVNFDANYGAAFRTMDVDAAARESDRYAHPAQSREMILERNRLSNQLSVSYYQRPLWDTAVLLENGIIRITIDLEIGARVYPMTQPDAIPDTKEKKPDHAVFFMITGELPERG